MAGKPIPMPTSTPSFKDVGVSRSFDPAVELNALGFPMAKPYCLQNLTLCVTGQLEKATRDEFHDLVRHYGGSVAKSVVKKLNYLVTGDAPGTRKLQIARERGVTILNESQFFDWYPSLPAQDPAPVPTTTKKAAASKKKKPTTTMSSTSSSSSTSSGVKAMDFTPPTRAPRDADANHLWTTKYAPHTMDDLVGNSSAINTLYLYLKNWRTAFVDNIPVKVKGNNGKMVAFKFRAALLSGPPGVGKSSAAAIVARAAGFHPIEFNASDTRNKSSLQAHVRSLTENKTMHSFFGSSKPKAKAESKNHLLIMDEIDGMGGGDRGGLVELMSIIASTRVPIICMCNDSSSQKMRQVKSKMLHLSFQRPTPKQLTKRMREIVRIEGMELAPGVLDQLVNSTSDLRQLINLLQMLGVDAEAVSMGAVKSALKTAKKNVTRTPFAVVEDFLKGEKFRALGINSLNSYFEDTSIVPLLVQENYLSTRPFMDNGHPLRVLDMMKRSADSIAEGDVLEARARVHSSFKYMPIHAVLSCVIPGFYMHGHIQGRLMFSSYLGKYSTSTKFNRLARQLTHHMSLRISASSSALVCDYAPALATSLMAPLSSDAGIQTVVNRMLYYHLSREDWNDITNIATFSSALKSLAAAIPTKTKSAFTRTLKKSITALGAKLPFHDGSDAKKLSSSKSGKGKKRSRKEDDLKNDRPLKR